MFLFPTFISPIIIHPSPGFLSNSRSPLYTLIESESKLIRLPTFNKEIEVKAVEKPLFLPNMSQNGRRTVGAILSAISGMNNYQIKQKDFDWIDV